MGKNKSVETILTVETRENESEWSEVWSVTRVPALDAGFGNAGGRGRDVGRNRIRISTMVLGTLLTMHLRVSSCALTGGYFIFMLVLIPSVCLLANPMRHFEIYLGQWSISGPGRAFRIVPVLDGIGVAMCINAFFRAICCATFAAIAGVYVLQGLSDDKLPFTYCRSFNLTAYEPEVVEQKKTSRASTVGTILYAWRKPPQTRNVKPLTEEGKKLCKEVYPDNYPGLFLSPPYNYFYVEVMRLHPDYRYGTMNLSLLWCILFVWVLLWLILLYEEISEGKLRWNSSSPLFLLIPCFWAATLLVTSVISFINKNKSLKKLLKLNPKQMLHIMSDGMEVALYIHAASLGTELIFGKGLNHFALGHIDPRLNAENVWHSTALLIFTIINAGGSALCALVDHKYAKLEAFEKLPESSLWIIPMYSKCCSFGSYTHTRTTLLFLGLMVSYVVVAALFLKASLHAIFEYKVKLVFKELLVVAGLILLGFLLSLLFAANGGLPLLESVDSMMTGLAMPLICLIELVAFMYVYESPDFVSDMNVATEENVCSTRIYYQWHFIPFITLIALILKCVVLAESEYPSFYLYLATTPIFIIIAAIPLRTSCNIYKFLRRDKK